MGPVSGRTAFKIATSLPAREVIDTANEVLDNFGSLIPQLLRAEAVYVSEAEFSIELQADTTNFEEADKWIDEIAEAVVDAIQTAFAGREYMRAVRRGMSELVAR